MDYKVIGAIGDSITNGYWDEEGLGWFGRLSQRIVHNFPLLYGFNNMSQSGDRVCDVYYRCLNEVASRDVDILLIAVGVNDLIRYNDPHSENALSKAIRDKYWGKLLDMAQKVSSQIVVFDILPVCEKRVPFEPDGDRKLYWFNRDIVEYNLLIENICKARKIPFIKRYEQWCGRDLEALYFDAAHPNASGHKLICDEAYDALVGLKVIG